MTQRKLFSDAEGGGVRGERAKVDGQSAGRRGEPEECVRLFDWFGSYLLEEVLEREASVEKSLQGDGAEVKRLEAAHAATLIERLEAEVGARERRQTRNAFTTAVRGRVCGRLWP